MWFLKNHVLSLTALGLIVFPQKAMANLKCVSQCGNQKNTLNYSFCYTNSKFTTWEYCLPNAEGSNTNQINVSQTGLINVGSTSQKKGETRLTILTILFCSSFAGDIFSPDLHKNHVLAIAIVVFALLILFCLKDKIRACIAKLCQIRHASLLPPLARETRPQETEASVSYANGTCRMV